MAYQIDCGDLIIDAVLTDIGRKKIIRGDLMLIFNMVCKAFHVMMFYMSRDYI